MAVAISFSLFNIDSSTFMIKKALIKNLWGRQLWNFMGTCIL